MRTTGSVLLIVAAVSIQLSSYAAIAASLNNHYEIDLQNYRACKVDADGHRLSTCLGNDIRSGSKYFLAGSTQGSISVTSAGVVKARIDGLSLDDGVSYACTYQSFHCNTTTGFCLDGPGAGTTTCTTDSQCSAYACDGGPQNDKGCNPVNPDAVCRSLASVTGIASVVFGGNELVFTSVGGVVTYKLLGDTADAENGCTKICAMNTDNLGKINSNALSCTVVGDGGCDGINGYHVVKVLDLDGKVVAVPGVGTATTNSGLGLNDPVQYGDVCRGGSPPADCADDQ